MKEQTNFTGKVINNKFGKGSKSEHDAIYLETSDDTHVLRRIGGNPFNDSEFQKLVGKKITAKGFIDRSILFVKEWKEEKE